MGINMFDKPAEAQFMNTYVELPFKEIAAMGAHLDKTREEAEKNVGLIGAQDLKYITDEGQDDEKRAREIMASYEEEMAKIPQLYYKDPQAAKRASDELARKLDRDMKRGEWYSIQSRYDRRQADIKEIWDVYMDPKSKERDPVKGRYYLSQLSANQRDYDPATGSFNQVIGAKPVPIWDEKRKQDYFEKDLNSIQPNQIVDSDNLKYVGKYSVTEILRNPDLFKYVDKKRLRTILAGRVAAAPDLLLGENELGKIMGAKNDWSDIYNVDDEGNLTGFNMSTPLGAYLENLSTGYAYNQKTKGSTISITNEEDKQRLSNKIKKEATADLVNITQGVVQEITPETYDSHVKNLTTAKTELDRLEKIVLDPKNKNNADYKETYDKYIQAKASYYNSQNYIKSVEEQAVKELGLTKNQQQHLQNWNNLDKTKYGEAGAMLAYLDKLGIKISGQGYNVQKRKDGSMDPNQVFGYHSLPWNAITTKFAQATGLNLNEINKKTKQVIKDKNLKGYSETPLILNDQVTGEFKSIVGETNTNNTNQYLKSGGIGWETLDGKQVEAWILDNVDNAEKVSTNNRQILATTGVNPRNGLPIHTLSILDKNGKVIATLNVTKSNDDKSSQYDKIAGLLTTSNTPETQNLGYQMYGMSDYQIALKATNIDGMKIGEKKKLPFTAPVGVIIPGYKKVSAGEELNIKAIAGSDSKTIEYQIVDNRGVPYTKICAGQKELFQELGKISHHIQSNQ